MYLIPSIIDLQGQSKPFTDLRSLQENMARLVKLYKSKGMKFAKYNIVEGSIVQINKDHLSVAVNWDLQTEESVSLSEFTCTYILKEVSRSLFKISMVLNHNETI